MKYIFVKTLLVSMLMAGSVIGVATCKPDNILAATPVRVIPAITQHKTNTVYRTDVIKKEIFKIKEDLAREKDGGQAEKTSEKSAETTQEKELLLQECARMKQHASTDIKKEPYEEAQDAKDDVIYTSSDDALLTTEYAGETDNAATYDDAVPVAITPATTQSEEPGCAQDESQSSQTDDVVNVEEESADDIENIKEDSGDDTQNEKTQTQNTKEANTEQTKSTSKDTGSVLTKEGGVNYYGDQKETYYNLPMDTVVKIASSQGIEGEYWEREDGVKMLGDYVMVAANRDVHPQGSLVETSLGTAIVVDTGGFAKNNPTQVDIAVNW